MLASIVRRTAQIIALSTLLATTAGTAADSAHGAASGDTTKRQPALKLRVNVKTATPDNGAVPVTIAVKTRRGARCQAVAIAVAGRAALPALRADVRGRAAWKWSAASGRWSLTVRCAARGRRATARATVVADAGRAAVGDTPPPSVALGAPIAAGSPANAAAAHPAAEAEPTPSHADPCDARSGPPASGCAFSEGIASPDLAATDDPPPATGGGSDQYLPWAQGVVRHVNQGNAQGPSHHTSTTRHGWDFHFAYGEEVRTGISGVVHSINNTCHATRSWGCGWGWGRYVLVRAADGTCAMLAHLSAVNVAPGQHVGRYGVVGWAGSSGNSTGVHLHYGRMSCGSQSSVASAFIEAGVPGTGARVRSDNRPDVDPRVPRFSNLRVYSNPTVDVTAGDRVRLVVVARYEGPGGRPCGLVHLGNRDPQDQPVRYADHAAGFWPASPWADRTRVKLVGCSGDLRPGDDAVFHVDLRPPLGHPGGTEIVGRMSIVHDTVAWSDMPPVALAVRVHRALRGEVTLRRYPRLLAPGTGETGAIEVHVRNRSTVSWGDSVRLAGGVDGDGSFRLAADGVVAGTRVPYRHEGDGADGTISPGETAVFRWTVRAPDGPTAFEQRFHLALDGVAHFGQDMDGGGIPMLVASASRWPVELRSGQCDGWSLVHQDAPVTVTGGAPARFTWVLRNTSRCPWFREGVHPWRLGTDQPRDGASPFYTRGDAAWLAAHRLQMKEEVVAPGETATVTFLLSRPSGMAATADARLYATPVLDGLQWLPSIGMYAPIRVQ